MDINLTEIATTVGVVLTSIGGFEFIKWFFFRKSNKKKLEEELRQEEMETKKSKIEADSLEFRHLQERIKFAELQLLEKEKRFHEQTEVLRETNRQLLDRTIEHGELKAEISALKAERKLKLCERKGCKQRVPQSDY